MLTLCRGCRRHVRNVEPACPFCRTAVRRPQLAAVVLGAVLTSACGGSAAEPAPSDGTTGDETRADGTADTGPDAGPTVTERGPDGSGTIAAYGAPAPPTDPTAPRP